MNKAVGFLGPGLAQIKRGMWVEGGGAFALWIGLIALVMMRFDRVREAVADGGGERVALIVLVLLLVGIWAWSHLEDRRRHLASEVEAGHRAGDMAGWWDAFKKNRMALFGLFFVAILSLAALLAPLLAPFDPLAQPGFETPGNFELRLAPPSLSALMGRDQISRDVFSRLLYGARISLTVGVLASGISVALGTLLGAASGYAGGWVDKAIMRFVDMVMAFPRIVLLIAVVAVFEQATLSLIVVTIALTQWPFAARLVRGEILSLKEREFAEAARALGFSRTRILLRHLLPNAMAPVMVAAALGVGNAMLLEAGLSFLGFGVPVPQPSWGGMISHGLDHLFNAWWISTFPGLVLAFSVLSFNLVADGLGDALDPRMGKKARP